jgi:hypothetical protein
MACGDYATYLEYWLAGQFQDAVICPYQETMTMPVFALFVFGGIGISLYIYADGVSLPLALLVILGGLVVPQLPGPAVQLIAVAALLAIMIAGYLLQSRTRDYRP